jgi:hypothetical protein
MRKLKGKGAQETQMLGGMPRSKGKVTIKTKSECPTKVIKRQIKEMQQKKRIERHNESN